MSHRDDLSPDDVSNEMLNVSNAILSSGGYISEVDNNLCPPVLPKILESFSGDEVIEHISSQADCITEQRQDESNIISDGVTTSINNEGRDELVVLSDIRKDIQKDGIEMSLECHQSHNTSTRPTESTFKDCQKDDDNNDEPSKNDHDKKEVTSPYPIRSIDSDDVTEKHKNVSSSSPVSPISIVSKVSLDQSSPIKSPLADDLLQLKISMARSHQKAAKVLKYASDASHVNVASKLRSPIKESGVQSKVSLVKSNNSLSKRPSKGLSNKELKPTKKKSYDTLKADLESLKDSIKVYKQYRKVENEKSCTKYNPTVTSNNHSLASITTSHDADGIQNNFYKLPLTPLSKVHRMIAETKADTLEASAMLCGEFNYRHERVATSILDSPPEPIDHSSVVDRIIAEAKANKLNTLLSDYSNNRERYSSSTKNDTSQISSLGVRDETNTSSNEVRNITETKIHPESYLVDHSRTFGRRSNRSTKQKIKINISDKKLVIDNLPQSEDGTLGGNTFIPIMQTIMNEVASGTSKRTVEVSIAPALSNSSSTDSSMMTETRSTSSRESKALQPRMESSLLLDEVDRLRLNLSSRSFSTSGGKGGNSAVEDILKRSSTPFMSGSKHQSSMVNEIELLKMKMARGRSIPLGTTAEKIEETVCALEMPIVIALPYAIEVMVNRFEKGKKKI